MRKDKTCTGATIMSAEGHVWATGRMFDTAAWRLSFSPSETRMENWTSNLLDIESASQDVERATANEVR